MVHPECDAQMVYTSSDEAVATVDENGVITAVAPGNAEITVTASQGDVTVSDTCKVVVLSADAAFTAFETRTNTWASIGRMDLMNITALSEKQEPVLAAAYVGDAIYGFDTGNNLFKVEGDAFNRTVIGDTGLELGARGEIGVDYLDIRAMAYDAANDRLLVLGAKCVDNEYDGWGYTDEYIGSNVIYQVNLENGNLTEVVTLNYEDDVVGMLANVRGLTVDGSGNVYVYSPYDDYFSQINMQTGAFTHKCTLQSLGIYASSEHNMPMAYDAATGLVYCLFTSNGFSHQLLSFNPLTAQVKNQGEVGEVVFNDETYENEGPTFSALLIK